MDNVVAGLSSKDLEEIAKGQNKSATLNLPKFKHEGGSIDLNKVLNKMGINDAFSLGAADFSRIIDEPLNIDKVFHQTFLEIDEEGMEATAATAAAMELCGEWPNPELKFTVDRPFFYAIQDSKTGLCLFMGVVKNL